MLFEGMLFEGVDPSSSNSKSKANFSFQFIASYVWYTVEKLAGDLLFGLKFVKLSILPTLMDLKNIRKTSQIIR